MIKIRRNSTTRTLFFVGSDAVLIAASITASFLVRFELTIPSLYWQGSIQWAILLALASFLPVFFLFRLHSLSWSYVSTGELFSLVKGVALGGAIWGVVLLLLRPYPPFISFPRSIFVISILFIFLAASSLRLAKRMSRHLRGRKAQGERRRVLIVGAGDAGEQLVRSVEARTSHQAVCFVDDSDSKQGVSIHGVRVEGRIKNIPELVARHGIEEIVVAMPSADSSVIRQAVALAREAGLRDVKVLPSLTEILGGKVSMGDVRSVQVKDLLGRESVVLDTESIASSIAGRRVLVTGAAGSIGSELARQIAGFYPSSLTLVDQDESGIFYISEELKEKYPKLSLLSFVADVREPERVGRIFSQVRPQLVFHAAAYKHVPLMEMEENAMEAVANNIFGTKVVVEAAASSGVERFVFISTDKAVNPSSIMGATKRVGEIVCQVSNARGLTKFISVRFGNVLDSRGNVVSVFRSQIERGGPVRVTHPDMQRYFMTTPEACLLVLQAEAMGEGGEVFVLDMGKPVKIVDLAKEMIRLAGLEPDRDVPIVFTEPRPGEKLSEEILTAEEGAVSTKHQKIYTARSSEPDPKRLDAALERLGNAETRAEIQRALADIIPSYRS